MVASKRPLRPMRIDRPRSGGRDDGDLRPVPDPVPERAMAPEWVSPTEGNGSDAPRADLHIALVAPNKEIAGQLNTVRVIKPPLWKGGKVYLHVLIADKAMVDLKVAQAMVDNGLLDSRDLQIGPPDGLTAGYPSGLKEGQR